MVRALCFDISQFLAATDAEFSVRFMVCFLGILAASAAAAAATAISWAVNSLDLDRAWGWSTPGLGAAIEPAIEADAAEISSEELFDESIAGPVISGCSGDFVGDVIGRDLTLVGVSVSRS